MVWYFVPQPLVELNHQPMNLMAVTSQYSRILHTRRVFFAGIVFAMRTSPYQSLTIMMAGLMVWHLMPEEKLSQANSVSHSTKEPVLNFSPVVRK